MVAAVVAITDVATMIAVVATMSTIIITTVDAAVDTAIKQLTVDS